MPDVDLSYAFGLTPEKAVKFFQDKGYKIGWDWRETLQEAHTKAFTVAKVMQVDVLQDIRQALDTNLVNGGTLAQFKKDLIPTLQQKGWWGEVVNEQTGEMTYVNARRLDTIYQTNLQTSYMAGQFKSMMDNVTDRPFWMYVAVMDGRTRPAHRAMHGKVFRYDDPIWSFIYPPNGFRCRCRVRSLSAAEVEAMGLKVESSDGKLDFVDVPLGDDGSTIKVARYRGVDDQGQKFAFSPDPGWSYNPGESWMEPFIPRPVNPDNLIATSDRVISPKVPIEDLPAKPFDTDMLLPAHQVSGWSEEEYVRRFLQEFGADIGTPVVFHDAIDDAVVISDELFLDRADNQFKVFKADREVYLKLLADTIKDPVEIWLTETQGKEAIRLCKRYVGVYQGDIDKVGGFVVFDLIDGMWQGTTTFKPKNLNYLDKQRAGTLLYTKK